MFQPFEIGDEVQLKNGWTPMPVRAIEYMTRRHPKTRAKYEGWWIRAQYQSSLKWGGKKDEDCWENWRPAEDYIPVNQGETDMTDEVTENVKNGALFQTKETKPRFGTKIAINSQGQIVLEMKGKDGEVEAFEPSTIEEVIPHTARFRKLSTGPKQEVHLQVPVGSVAKGNIIIDIHSGAIFSVTDTDTKRRSAGKPTGMFVKVATEEISLN